MNKIKQWGTTSVLAAITGVVGFSMGTKVPQQQEVQQQEVQQQETAKEFTERYLEDVKKDVKTKRQDDYSFWCGKQNLLRTDIPIPIDYQVLFQMTAFDEGAAIQMAITLETEEGRSPWFVYLSPSQETNFCIWSVQLKP